MGSIIEFPSGRSGDQGTIQKETNRYKTLKNLGYSSFMYVGDQIIISPANNNVDHTCIAAGIVSAQYASVIATNTPELEVLHREIPIADDGRIRKKLFIISTAISIPNIKPISQDGSSFAFVSQYAGGNILISHFAKGDIAMPGGVSRTQIQEIAERFYMDLANELEELDAPER